MSCRERPSGSWGFRRFCQLLFGLILPLIIAGTARLQAALLWSDLGATQVHETGVGADILGGVLRRDDRSNDTLYFKFHVDPLSDATTEEYFAGFQLFEGNQERLAIGNALKAWAYSAFSLGQKGVSNQLYAYVDLNSAKPESVGVGNFRTYELPRWGIERTIVFKVQYVPGGDDLVTVWLDPDLRAGANESNQAESLTTHFTADASFDQIHLRHGGGGAGWIFSEMAIGTSFGDLVNANETDQSGDALFSFRSWQREQGLPENYVRALTQSRDGYLWVGSDEGVSRFDGLSFFSLGLQEGFQSGPIRVLFGDSYGAVWIGSVDGGLYRWEGKKVRKYAVSDGLPSMSINALSEDGQGRLWVGTQAGLALWQAGKLSGIPGAEAISGKPITALFCDRQGTMWIGASGAGVFSYREGKLEPVRDAALDNLLQDPRCLLVDHQGRLWVGAQRAFVLCRDGDQWRRFGLPQHLASHRITSLAEAPEDTVWAGSAGEGLFEFKAGKLVAINASSGLSDNTVEALFADREGKLWVGTHGGLNCLSTRYLSVLSHREGLGYGAVQSVAEVRPGEFWASKPSEGVYRWDGQRFSLLTLSGLPAGEPGVNSLLAARDGSCWVAGNFGLLHFADPENSEQVAGSPALTNQAIGALAQSFPEGDIWAGSRSGELWRFTSNAWVAQTNFVCHHPITAIVPDTGGNVWIGTEGDGVYKWNSQPGVACEKMRGLPSSWIRTLYVDAEHSVWIGTGSGLSRLRNDSLSTFTARDGLPDNTVSQILEDDLGNIWLGGNRGIVRVKKQDLEDLAQHKIPAVYPQIYGRADGMLSEECVSGFSPGGLRTQAGLLWFLTLKGIVVVDPHRTPNAPAPVVVLQEVLVDGVEANSVPVERGFSGPQDALSPPAQVRLAPGKHALEFHYTGLSFDAPERVRFRYRLDGLDANWVEAGTRRVALYSFVPPGQYHFRVIACNGDGVWNEQGAALELTVMPHFWQTWWFLGSAATGIVFAGVAGVRFSVRRRLQRRVKRLEQDRALERERTRIAQDLHDIMGAKLCRISFLSEDARRSESIPRELREQIGAVSDDSREVLRSLDEIVWAVNPEKDTIEHLVSYSAQYAQEYFRRTGIECEVQIPARLPDQPLTSQTRHHVFLAIHEALTNILKHSGATHAKVVMTCRQKDFEIVVSDNGRGFNSSSGSETAKSSTDGFGNGLSNMRRRLTELGGSFQVDSRPGQGTTVRFILYLNQPVS